MSRQREAQEPGGYELRVGRHLDDHWAEWFENLTLTRETDGTTTLRGPVADQAALHGLLAKIRDLGMTLISVRAIDGPPRGEITTTFTTSGDDRSPHGSIP